MAIPRTSLLELSLAILVATGSAGAASQTSDDTADKAIARIRSGKFVPIPPATSAPASAEAGRGLDVENDTGQTLLVHFRGPVSRTATVPAGQSVGIDLAVGEYEIAAEVLAADLTPFYGRQSYAPSTHYWLKFGTVPQLASASPLTVATVDPKLIATSRAGRERMTRYFPLRTGNKWSYAVRATRPGDDTPQYNLMESDIGTLLTSKNQRCAAVTTVEYTVGEPAATPDGFWHVSVSPAASPWGDKLLWGPVLKPIAFTTEFLLFYLAERQLTFGGRVGEQPKAFGIDRILMGGTVTGTSGGPLEIHIAEVPDQVRVPAGTFTDVLRSTVRTTRAPIATENLTVETYLAPGVGRIKEIVRNHEGDEVCTLELLAYSVR